jgi:predicted amidohydrolase
LILICADFFFSDLIHLVTEPPDVILVAALSVTRKPTPHYARALWRHLAVARAYEFGAYVGISDWAHTAALPSSAGVSGFADPTASDAGGLFIPTGDAGVAVHSIDRSALEAFRGDRRARGFFWRGAEAGTSGDVVS